MQANKSTGAVIASIVLAVLGLALLGYTASRTLDFIELTLPANSQIFGYFALAAFDGGLLGWMAVHMFHAKGEVQRGISLMMVAVSIVGVVAAFVADTLLVSGNKGVVQRLDQGSVYVVVVVMAIIIAGNITAAVGYHLSDPRYKARIADERLRHSIEEEARRQVEAHTPELAAQLAPHMAADQMNRMKVKYLSELGHGPTLPPPERRNQTRPTRPIGIPKARPVKFAFEIRREAETQTDSETEPETESFFARTPGDYRPVNHNGKRL